MARFLILGAGLAGMSAAYELRSTLGPAHPITVLGDGERFSFTPSNPWLAVGWRQADDFTLPAAPPLHNKDIAFSPSPAAHIDTAGNCVRSADGSWHSYDYLIICTGPQLAFAEVPGLGPGEGFTQSICTTAHAARAWEAYQHFLEDPGPIVIGAVQGASCFGPAYEFALILDTDLRRRRLRDRVPMSFVTSEPYIGHLGLGGVGDSKGMLESELRKRHIRWIDNARVRGVREAEMSVVEVDAHGEPKNEHVLPFRYAMLLPAFKGVDAVAAVEGLCNPRGFVLVDRHQRSVRHRNIFAAGVCVAIPPVESTPVPTGAPKTGFMIESMVTTLVCNIQAELHVRGHVECRLPGRHGRYGHRVRGLAADPAAQRHLDARGALGAPGQGRLREVLPVQDAPRHQRACRGEIRAGRTGHRAVEAACRHAPRRPATVFRLSP